MLTTPEEVNLRKINSERSRKCFASPSKFRAFQYNTELDTFWPIEIRPVQEYDTFEEALEKAETHAKLNNDAATASTGRYCDNFKPLVYGENGMYSDSKIVEEANAGRLEKTPDVLKILIKYNERNAGQHVPF